MLEDVLQIDYFFVYLSHQLIKPDRVGLFNVGKHSIFGIQDLCQQQQEELLENRKCGAES